MSKRTRDNDISEEEEGVSSRLAAGGFGRVDGSALASRKDYLMRQEAFVAAEIERTSRARSRTIGKQSDFFRCVGYSFFLMHTWCLFNLPSQL